MRRLNLVFLAVVLVAAAAGGATALQLHDDIGAVNTVAAVKDRLDVAVTDATLTDRGLEVTARVRNPTGYRFRVAGGVVSSQNASGTAVAYGAAWTVEDDVVVAPRGSRPVRLVLPLSTTMRQQLAASFPDGIAVTVSVSLYYDDVQFVTTGSGSVGGGGA